MSTRSKSRKQKKENSISSPNHSLTARFPKLEHDDSLIVFQEEGLLLTHSSNSVQFVNWEEDLFSTEDLAELEQEADAELKGELEQKLNTEGVERETLDHQLARLVKTLRLNCQITIEQMATRIGISVATLQAVEWEVMKPYHLQKFERKILADGLLNIWRDCKQQISSTANQPTSRGGGAVTKRVGNY